MSRRGISGALLTVAGLVPLALIIDFALLYASFPNALLYVVAIDVPIFAAIGVVVFISWKRAQPPQGAKESAPNPMDKLKERNGGRRAPTNSAKSILDKDEEEEAEVFLETPDVEKQARDVDEILQRMKAKEMNLGVGPDPEVEARPQPIIVEPEPEPESQLRVESPVVEPEVKPKGKVKDYALSPDKLRAPAFICPCGHAHRFVCLTCGMTVEQAAKKSKTHWVEWVPEMGAEP
jgi:hypothetical protein